MLKQFQNPNRVKINAPNWLINRSVCFLLGAAIVAAVSPPTTLQIVKALPASIKHMYQHKSTGRSTCIEGSCEANADALILEGVSALAQMRPPIG